MATLKEHQAAMVDLLANGSGIPASASRLAHAMHDLIAAHLAVGEITFIPSLEDDATTPGLNDKALAGDLEACRPKATPAERRVKELENTVKQLRAQVAKQRKEIAFLKMERNNAVAQLPEQAGCRKDDTQVLGDGAARLKQAFITAMDDANKWSGCRKEATQVCDHDWVLPLGEFSFSKCSKCGKIA